MENESFERALEPQQAKRKRSSILKPPEKRISRDSRTVSFNDRCIYKELHQDGTCDITNLFLREDMDLTMMDIVEPIINYQNQTINSSMDMSMEASVLSNHNTSELDNDRTLTEDNMIEVKDSLPSSPPSIPSSPRLSPQPEEDAAESFQHRQHHRLSTTMTEETLTQNSHTIHQQQNSLAQHPDRSKLPDIHNNSSQMDLTLVSQFINTMPKVNNIEVSSVNYDTSTIYDRKMSLASDLSGISSLHSSLVASSTSGGKLEANESSYMDTTHIPKRESAVMSMNNCSMTRISDISSFNSVNADQSANETFFGAFHDSNNMSIQSRASVTDTIMHNVAALNECIQKLDQESEDCRRKLDHEIAELLKFYRHIVNNDNKYEFALRIFGLRYSLWLIIKLNPETYPYEKIDLKFAVNKKDRHLYPFPEYAEAVKRCTKEGKPGYLTRFVINAQKFRRFLRAIGYRKSNK